MTPRYWFPKPYADFAQRLRVPGGFALIAAFAWLSNPSMASMAVGVPIAVLGLLLRAWAAGHLAKNQSLSTGGPYANTRNPLYLGTALTAAGLVIASRDLALAALFVVVFAGVYLPVIELEEQHLRTLFPGYAAYADRVPKLLPSLDRGSNAERFRMALYRTNQEYKAAFGFVVALSVLVWKII